MLEYGNDRAARLREGTNEGLSQKTIFDLIPKRLLITSITIYHYQTFSLMFIIFFLILRKFEVNYKENLMESCKSLGKIMKIYSKTFSKFFLNQKKKLLEKFYKIQ